MFVSTNQKDWDEHIPQVLFAYRVSPNATTGESPFYLLYGREPRLPLDISLLPPVNLSPSVSEHRARIVTTLEEARQLIATNTQRAQLRMKAQYDSNARPVTFSVGQRVWVYTPKLRKGLSKKLLHNYHGPYRIVEKLSPVNFRLRTLDNRPVSVPVHANRLKFYVDPNDRPVIEPPHVQTEPYLCDNDLPPESFDPERIIPSTIPNSTDIPPAETVTDDNQHQIFAAERIVRHRLRRGKCDYLVKWRGYSNRHNTWEPSENILDQRLWDDFYSRFPEQRPTNT